MPKRPKVDLPTLFEMKTPASNLAAQEAARPYSDPLLLLGTSAFTASGWEGSFYPKGMKSSQYLTHYGKTFRTVEIDSSFYGTPAAATVNGWYEKTPTDFIFALKVPQVISHEKVLKDCDTELSEFVDRISLLKEKLGPILLQFPLFKQYEFKSGADFLKRLVPFIRELSETLSGKLVIEIRNKDWLDERFLDSLCQHNVALALTDTGWIPRPRGTEKATGLDHGGLRLRALARASERDRSGYDRVGQDNRGSHGRLKELGAVYPTNDIGEETAAHLLVCQ
jgi:uncharacterized protein YecE (DUF72 family)